MRVEPTIPEGALAPIRAALQSAGAEPADAPLLQPLNLVLELAGEAMRARLFVVQAEGEAESCLRPDFTVAVARKHIEGGRPSGRYLYEGKAFRASAGADRPEEFLQLGVEMFAPANGRTEAEDAELAALAWRAAQAGGRGDLTLWLGDVGLLSPFIDALDLPELLAARLKRVAGRPRLLRAELERAGAAPAAASGGALAGILSGLSEDQAAALLEEVWSLSGVEPVGGRGPKEIAARLVRKSEAAAAPALTSEQAAALSEFMAISDTPDNALARIGGLGFGADTAGLKDALIGWSERLESLTDVIPADALRFSPALGHAFDYYDGLTFEVRSEALGAERPVAVGGRYDGLMSRLGGGAGRAIGCMVRPFRAWSEGEA